MDFYTSSKHKRPVRLSDKTRAFAYDSVMGVYGKDTLKVMRVRLENTAELSQTELYDKAMYEIVTKAPIRICEGELLCGAATLGDAVFHRLPAEADPPLPAYDTGTSHLTADFSEVLRLGMDGIRLKAEDALKVHTKPGRLEFLRSCTNTIDCMYIWHGRYLDALSGKNGYERVYENLQNVPKKPAASFYEAVQCIWFCFAFLRLSGCWPGIGRLDVLLGDYLKNDLEKGIITIDEAREILAHFFIKGCEWISTNQTVSGDAQHYQNIVLSGIDEDGRDVTNEVTYLVLDIIEETGISDFPTTVRINKNTDERLLRRVAEVICYGGGVVAVYNEDLILESLADMGYDKREARRFANDGCWEIQIPGKTNFGYIPFDGLALLQKKTLCGYRDVSFDSFDALFSKYLLDLSGQVGEIFKASVLDSLNEDGTSFKSCFPCTAISLFEQDCIKRGLSYKDGGTVYRVRSPHIGGLPDAANSLYAIKKAVFDDKLISFTDFMELLYNNWEGGEELRLRLLNDYRYYGNDNDEVDKIAADILDAFSDMCMEYDGRGGVLFVSGVSTFGRQIEWAGVRYAVPFGRRQGEILSGNLSPTPGTDKNSASGVIKSHCKANLKKQYTGAALDLCFIPSNLDSENAASAICALIKSFCSLGGFFMQIDTANKELLLDAQKNPANYPNLSVRISGWNARFATLSKEWQDMIIERAK